MLQFLPVQTDYYQHMHHFIKSSSALSRTWWLQHHPECFSGVVVCNRTVLGWLFCHKWDKNVEKRFSCFLWCFFLFHLKIHVDVTSHVSEGKVWDISLAFGAETGEVFDEELPREIILLYPTGLRRLCLAGQALPRITNLLEKSLVHKQ